MDDGEFLNHSHTRRRSNCGTHEHEPFTVQEFFTYHVYADGRYFMINATRNKRTLGPWDIILNWASQLKR